MLDDDLTESRSLQRSRRRRLVGGVCSGIAFRLGLDPGLVRAITLLACFVGGAGFIAYLAALVLLPAEPETAEPAEDSRVDSIALITGLFLLVSGALLAASIGALQMSLVRPTVGALWPALLATLLVHRAWSIRHRLHPDGLVRARPRVLLGVAAGLGRYLAWDPVLVRLLLVVVAVWSQGLAVLLYVVVAAFLPDEEA